LRRCELKVFIRATSWIIRTLDDGEIVYNALPINFINESIFQ